MAFITQKARIAVLLAHAVGDEIQRIEGDLPIRDHHSDEIIDRQIRVLVHPGRDIT
ncbi:MAG: hypothetical protein HN396_09035 [Gemmatimonadales bacterium]|jgi:hypothetical protein|nr:hypothetical protein [Gemmatimonadales bacterium]MDG2240919.1 hypothetical protein [Longimicrobiales bacterium]NCG33783.1 hypothetical protein [Pseudomonadota bacterium]MBT3498069.1 hypothetical protein [Gemmatimonadales bacterium]MBT3774358.1 hypothetical protein [Gemmatimonadales bacterium]